MSGMIFAKNEMADVQGQNEINFVRVCADIFGIKILPCLILEDTNTNWHVTKSKTKPFVPEEDKSFVCVFIRNTKKYFKEVTVDKFCFSDGTELVMDQSLLNKEFFGFSFEDTPVEIHLIADDIMILLVSNGFAWEVKKLAWISDEDKVKIRKRHEPKYLPNKTTGEKK